MNLLDLNDPVWLEPRLKLKKFVGFGNPRLIAILSFGLVIYAILLLVVTANREYLPPGAMIALQTFLFCLVSVSSTHAAIAGEREKRTWDTLLVAPITNAEIIIGKALVGLGSCMFVFLLFLVPVVICQVSNREAPIFGETVFSEIISCTFALFLASLGIYVSSRTKRAFSSQLALYTILFLLLIVAPGIVGLLANGAELRDILALNPFIAINLIGFELGGNKHIPFHSPIIYIIVSGFLLLFATARLTNEDGGLRLKGQL